MSRYTFPLFRLLPESRWHFFLIARKWVGGNRASAIWLPKNIWCLEGLSKSKIKTMADVKNDAVTQFHYHYFLFIFVQKNHANKTEDRIFGWNLSPLSGLIRQKNFIIPQFLNPFYLNFTLFCWLVYPLRSIFQNQPSERRWGRQKKAVTKKKRTL